MCSVLWCVAVCCSVLQCAAVCCSVLKSGNNYMQCGTRITHSACLVVLRCVAVCCCSSVLQSVADTH